MPDCDKKERIHRLKKPFWIGYPNAKRALSMMDELLNYPKTHRMPNMALVGETNNGKTMILEKFYRSQALDEKSFVENPRLPILLLQTPPEPDEGRLYSDILLKLFSTSGTRETASSKLQRIQTLLSSLKTQMIILDEFQHALAGTGKRLRRFLNGIKYIGNELSIPIVVAGTLETLAVLQSDPQVANRFEPMILPRWEMDHDFQRLLATIEPKLGLEKSSNLHEPQLAKRIIDESEGTIGEIMKLLRTLSKEAIMSGSECITLEMLESGHLKKIGWKAPSIRNRIN